MTTENKKFNWQESFKIKQIAEWYENNRRNANIGLVGLIVLVVGFYYYQNFYKPAKEDEAFGQLFMTERYFDKDSMNLVLNGDKKYPSVIDIIDDYGNTKAGNLARYYAGRAYMSKKQFNEALEYLEDAEFSDEIMSAEIIGLRADCYSELNEFEKSAGLYMKAATIKDNLYTSPKYLMKAGLSYEEIKNWEAATKAYKMIRDKYKESQQAQLSNKYIARSMAKMGKTPD